MTPLSSRASVPGPSANGRAPRRERLLRASGIASLIVLGGIGAVAARNVDWPTPWSKTEGSTGIPRQVEPVDTVGPAADEGDTDDMSLPPYLSPRSPGHLDDQVIEVSAPPAVAADTNTRASAPAAPTETTPPTSTTPPTTTTTTAPPPSTTGAPPVSTTTTSPPTTTTVPVDKDEKEDEEPDGTPVAVGDTFSLSANTIESLDVLANDSDPDGDIGSVTLSLVSGPSHAFRFSVDTDHFRYRSYNANLAEFSPEDSFVYQICDESGRCDTATVTLHIGS